MEKGENRFGRASFIYGILSVIPPLLIITWVILRYFGIYFDMGDILRYFGIYFYTYDIKLYIQFIISFILSVFGIVFYFKQKKIKSTGLAKAGLVLSIIGILLLLIIIIFWLSMPVIKREDPGFPADCFTVSVEPIKCTLNSGVATITVKRNIGEGEFTNLDALLIEGNWSNGNVKKVSPSASGVLTSSNLKEQETKDLVVTIPENFVPASANIVLTSKTGQLCQIVTKPVTCN